eukprot:TRINITY_DN8461_c0_g2_i18.p1 TRINITY_DN8461_c0_g2~~TRINITY_DN8461_c0_g2_i18.p1  ORF type:complete len:542 (-),score=124.91 TRINITY_DN8461_c0_g2_i18:87-1712(-)
MCCVWWWNVSAGVDAAGVGASFCDGAGVGVTCVGRTISVGFGVGSVVGSTVGFGAGSGVGGVGFGVGDGDGSVSDGDDCDVGDGDEHNLGTCSTDRKDPSTADQQTGADDDDKDDDEKFKFVRRMYNTRRLMRATWFVDGNSHSKALRTFWNAFWKHTLCSYFSNWWNSIELVLIITTTLFLFFAWCPPVSVPNPFDTTVSELWDSYFWVQLAIFFGSISIILTWFQFTHYMTVFHDSFGALILSLTSMIPDILYFFLLLTVIITGYSAAMDIIYAGVDDRWSSFTFAFLNNLLSAFGQTQEAESNYMYPWSINLYMVVGDIILSVYLLATGITLINLLIALLTATYEDFAENSLAFWRMSKAKKLLHYERFPLTPGFMIIYDVFYMFYTRSHQVVCTPSCTPTPTQAPSALTPPREGVPTRADKEGARKSYCFDSALWYLGNVPFAVDYNLAYKQIFEQCSKLKTPGTTPPMTYSERNVVEVRDELLENAGKLMEGIWGRVLRHQTVKGEIDDDKELLDRFCEWVKAEKRKIVLQSSHKR